MGQSLVGDALVCANNVGRELFWILPSIGFVNLAASHYYMRDGALVRLGAETGVAPVPYGPKRL